MKNRFELDVDLDSNTDSVDVHTSTSLQLHRIIRMGYWLIKNRSMSTSSLCLVIIPSRP